METATDTEKAGRTEARDREGEGLSELPPSPLKLFSKGSEGSQAPTKMSSDLPWLVEKVNPADKFPSLQQLAPQHP